MKLGKSKTDLQEAQLHFQTYTKEKFLFSGDRTVREVYTYTIYFRRTRL